MYKNKRLVLVLPILAMLLALPSLWVGFGLDDWYQHAWLLENRDLASLPKVMTELFVFLDGDPQRTQGLMDVGILPWWALDTVHVAFWRPLSAFTHWLDHVLWPGTPWLMHLHSLLWFGLVIVLVTLLYQRLMGATLTAGLAALLYAVDDAHGFAVAWIANRNILLATCFGALTLLAYDRWRRGGWRMGAIVVPLTLLLALLSAEAAVAVFAYLFAYTLFLDAGPTRRRWFALLPSVVVVLAWRAVYTLLGHRAWGVAIYLDPAAEPLRFISAMTERIPVLLLGQWAFPPTDLYAFLPPEITQVWWLVAGLFILVTGIVLLPLIRHEPQARFWATGMILACVPASAAQPNDRLLFFVGIGAMGLLARFLVALREKPAWLPSGLLWRVPAMALAVFLLLIHLVLAPLSLPLRAWPNEFKTIEESIVHLPAETEFAQQTTVMVTAPSFFHTAHIPIIRRYMGKPAPAHVRLLSSGFSPVELSRVDDFTLSLLPEQGYLQGLAQYVRDPKYPMELGQRILLTGMEVEVTAMMPDGRPAEAEFRFTVPLEDPTLRWFHWSNGRYQPFTPPAVGESIRVPAAIMLPFSE